MNISSLLRIASALIFFMSVPAFAQTGGILTPGQILANFGTGNAPAKATSLGTGVSVGLAASLNASGGLVGFSGNIGAAAGTSLALGGCSGSVLCAAGAASLPGLTYLAPFTGAVSQTQLNKNSQTVSVMDFGALGNSNGTTGNGNDDTSAFQAAVTYATANGALIDVPCGVFRLTTSVTNSGTNPLTRVVGHGYCSKIYLDSVTNISAFVINPSATCASSLLPCTYILGVNFIAPTTATAGTNRALSINNSQGAVITGNWFDGYYTPVTITNSFTTQITNNTFTNSKAGAIFNPSTDATFNNGLIGWNKFFSNGSVTGDAAVSLGASNGGLTITGNDCENNAACFLFGGVTSGVSFTNNYMESSTSFDIFFSAISSGWTIVGNRIGSGKSTTYTDLTYSHFAPNVIAGGSTIQFDPTTSMGNYIEPQVLEAGTTFLANDGAGTGATRYSGILALVNPLGVASGGSGANLSATGGASQVLKQVSAGAGVTVGQLACGDLSNSGTACAASTGTLGATIPLNNGNNTVSGTQTHTAPINFSGLAWSNAAPTISSGFCTGPSIVNSNGTAAFTINVGTACAASTGVIGMPTAAHGWACHFADITTSASNVPYQTGGSSNTVNVTNYGRTTGVAGNFTSSDVLVVECTGY